MMAGNHLRFGSVQAEAVDATYGSYDESSDAMDEQEVSSTESEDMSAGSDEALPIESATHEIGDGDLFEMSSDESFVNDDEDSLDEAAGTDEEQEDHDPFPQESGTQEINEDDLVEFEEQEPEEKE